MCYRQCMRLNRVRATSHGSWCGAAGLQGRDGDTRQERCKCGARSCGDPKTQKSCKALRAREGNVTHHTHPALHASNCCIRPNSRAPLQEQLMPAQAARLKESIKPWRTPQP